MNPLKKKKIAEEIWNLELKCQSEKDVSQDFEKMEALHDALPI